MISESEKRELAERHWRYTAGLLQLTSEQPTEREHYLYVQAMIHGMKHTERENESK